MKKIVLRATLMFLLGVGLVVGIEFSKSSLALTLPTTVSQCAEKTLTGIVSTFPTKPSKRCAPSTLPKPSEQTDARVKGPSSSSDQYLNLPRATSAQYAEYSLKRDSSSVYYPVAEPLKSHTYLPQGIDSPLGT